METVEELLQLNLLAEGHELRLTRISRAREAFEEFWRNLFTSAERL